MFEGANSNDQAVAGRYVLRPAEGDVFPNSNRNNLNDDHITSRNDEVVLENTISATADRLLPGTVRLRVRVYDDQFYWYNQGNRGLPELREGASIGLYSERDNMRFKPFLTYEVLRTDQFDSVQKSLHGRNHPRSHHRSN